MSNTNWWHYQGWADGEEYLPMSELTQETVVSPTYAPQDVSVVPIPAAVWMFASALVALVCVKRRGKNNGGYK